MRELRRRDLLLVALTFAAGSVDAVALLRLDVFTAVMTGNIALPHSEPEQDDVASHDSCEDVESKERDRIDGARSEGQRDKKEVATPELAHVSAGRELVEDVGKRREVPKHAGR